MNITDLSSSTFINILLLWDHFVARYCLSLLFFLGIIGLTFNTIIFTRKTFRNTSCIFYFLSSNIANYPIVFFAIPCRFFADGFNMDPTTSSLAFCKFREYVLTVSRSLSAWFVVLATFDRLMSTSTNVHYRQFCHILIARRLSVLTTFLAFFFYLHTLILFTNHARSDQCEALVGTYRIVNDCLYSLCYVIIPSLLMLSFGLLTIKNRKNRRIMPAFSTLNTIKRDRILFLMIIFQVILFICTTSPYGIQKLYITLTADDIITDDAQNIINNLITDTARMISFINHSCQFYIVTLSSKLFRQELKKFIVKVLTKY